MESKSSDSFEERMASACNLMNEIANGYLGRRTVRRVKKQRRKLTQEEKDARAEKRKVNEMCRCLKQIPTYSDYHAGELYWLQKYIRKQITQEQWLDYMQTSRKDKTWGVIEQ